MIYIDHNGTTPIALGVSGFACLADSPDPSHVVAAMKPAPAVRQIIRFSLGAENTAARIRDSIAAVQHCAAALGGVR